MNYSVPWLSKNPTVLSTWFLLKISFCNFQNTYFEKFKAMTVSKTSTFTANEYRFSLRIREGILYQVKKNEKILKNEFCSCSLYESNKSFIIMILRRNYYEENDSYFPDILSYWLSDYFSSTSEKVVLIFLTSKRIKYDL